MMLPIGRSRRLLFRTVGVFIVFSLTAVVGYRFVSAKIAETHQPPGSAQFKKKVEPLLNQYCADCHEGGTTKGNIDFDAVIADHGSGTNHELWLKVVKNLRAGLMPPQKKARPSPKELAVIENWVKYKAFQIDPKNPDPGRVTVRRLNRAEYRNTVRDLLGVDYDTSLAFPPDDTGYGFDDISDVLTISPMLLEKYLDAAQNIVQQVVPNVHGVPGEKVIAGKNFRQADATNHSTAGPNNSLILSYYEETAVSNAFTATHDGHYQLLLEARAYEKTSDPPFDFNRCDVRLTCDGVELLHRELAREMDRPVRMIFEQDLKAGPHELVLEMRPTTATNQTRSLSVRLDNVTVRGPMDPQYYVPPKNYAKYFPKGDPGTPEARHQNAAELLGAFAEKAYRHPVDKATVDRLTSLAESIYSQPGQTYEAGISQGMVAVLASPRFLFREENVQPAKTKGAAPQVDEYSLASRLSYFLWSTMPDQELLDLAAQNKLRQNLAAQVKRMLADSKSDALMANFSGQWLQARDIENVPIDSPSVLARESTNAPGRGGGGRRGAGAGAGGRRGGPAGPQMTTDIRVAMRQETEAYFAHIVRDDRPVTELIESDYTYLNDRLAKYYGLTNLNVTGSQMRQVTLPPDSPRGGVLTMGTVLAVTSNPTRTSPVKRGLFILDNVLGVPPPPPPANIPPLEDSEKGLTNHTPTLREVLKTHREDAMCASCHNRLDPPGLALENFNAMGLWRTQEHGQPIEADGKLITGEKFENVRELKHILATDHRLDFYRTLTEKMLTYALGRGLEYYDLQTVDQIVDDMDKNGGKFSTLLTGVIDSAPFQKRRETVAIASDPAPPAAKEHAEIKHTHED